MDKASLIAGSVIALVAVLSAFAGIASGYVYGYRHGRGLRPLFVDPPKRKRELSFARGQQTDTAKVDPTHLPDEPGMRPGELPPELHL